MQGHKKWLRIIGWVALALLIVAVVVLLGIFITLVFFPSFLFLVGVQFIIGNILIGMLEGVVARWALSRRYGVRTPFMWRFIPANYTVMGSYLLLWLFVARFEPALLGQYAVLRLPYLVAGVLLVAFLLAFSIKWGFFAFGLRSAIRQGMPGRFGMSLFATLIAMAASLLVLVPLYYFTSETSLFTRVHRERGLRLAKTPQAVVYFYPPNSRDLHAMRLDGSTPQSVKEGSAGEQQVYEMLSLYGDASGGFRRPIDLRPRWQREISVSTDTWGLVMTNVRTGTRQRIGLAMPFFCWHPGYIFILPGDQVLFQVGGAYQVLYDPHTQQIDDLGLMNPCPIVVIPGMKYEPEE